MQETGAANDLLERLGADPAIPFSAADLGALHDARALTGRAAEQVDRFLESDVTPFLEGRRHGFDDDAPDVSV